MYLLYKRVVANFFTTNTRLSINLNLLYLFSFKLWLQPEACDTGSNFSMLKNPAIEPDELFEISKENKQVKEVLTSLWKNQF